MFDFQRKERTNFLPLRWFGNGCEYFAHLFLNRYLEAEYKGRNWILPVYAKLSSLFYKPSIKWGTYYVATFPESDLKKNG